MAEVCGIDAETIRRSPALCHARKRSIIFWGMGISQHVHGTDNARCLISLALITGQVGRPGTGLHPLRGQNNVQGASDAGLIPMVFPDYQTVRPMTSAHASKNSGASRLDPKPGLTVVEIMDASTRATSRACTSWAKTRPCRTRTRPRPAALAKLDHLVVQDIFLTETASTPT